MPRIVLYLAWAPFFSGAERALLLTLQHLDPTRYCPFVLAGHDGEVAECLRDARIPHQVTALAGLTRPHLLAGLGSTARVAQTARRLHAAVIHANEVPAFEPGGYAARLLRVPAVTHVRFPMGPDAYRWFLRAGFSRAIFVSEHSRQESVAAAPAVFAGRSAIIHDGVLVPEPMSRDQRCRIRTDLDVPVEADVVALVGQLTEVKGIWDFLEAAFKLAPRHDRALFVVVGDDLQHAGALRREMEARARAHGLADRFRFTGYRRDAASLMGAFDIVAMPSLVEPLGLSALEAMAAGVAVVCTRVGGLLETVEDGGTGLTVPPADPGALADALGRLLEDRELRSRLGRAGRERVIARFSASRHAERLQALYDDVIAGYGLRHKRDH